MRKLLFTLAIVLVAVDVYAAEKVVSTSYSTGDLSLAYSIIQASKFSTKIKEYGVGAVLTLSGSVTTYAIGRSLFTAFRETRALAVDFLGTIVRGAVFSGAVGTVAGKLGKTAGELGKKAGGITKKAGSKVAGKLGQFRKVSPSSVKTPFDGYSPMRVGGVGIGRTVSPADLLEGKIGSSRITKLSSPKGELLRKGDSWVDASGKPVSPEKLSELTSSNFLKAELADGTSSYLTKSGGVFRERVGPDVLSSSDKLSYRLSRDEVVIDYNKLTGDKVTEIVNTLPVGAKVEVIGPLVKNKDGKMEFKKVAFKKTEEGFRLYDKFGIGRDKSIQDKFRQLNSDRKFQRSKKVTNRFFDNLFNNDEDENVR